jgi:hypothetical protein
LKRLAAQKLDPGQQNIFGFKEVGPDERIEIYKLVTYNFQFFTMHIHKYSPTHAHFLVTL